MDTSSPQRNTNLFQLIQLPVFVVMITLFNVRFTCQILLLDQNLTQVVTVLKKEDQRKVNDLIQTQVSVVRMIINRQFERTPHPQNEPNANLVSPVRMCSH